MASLRKRLRPRLLLVYAVALAILLSARPSPISFALGLLPIAAGVALRVWATGYLHKNDALTVSGPYAYLRHPLYLGTLLVGTGFAWMAASPLALGLWAFFLAAYFLYYLPYKERIECARLESLYGDAFRRYATAVPALLPRLHAYQPLAGEGDTTLVWNRERFADNHELGMALAIGLGVAALVAMMVGRWSLA